MSCEVAIIQRRLPHYRVPLFEALRSSLAVEGINLRVLHGNPTPAEKEKNDSGRLAWAELISTRYLAGGKFMWQPFAELTKSSDLVIVPQENKHLNNLPMLLNPWRKQKLAFWGHGRNMQSLYLDGLSERFKRWTTRQVDWWFAYTEISAGFIRDAGFPGDRITVLNNSIDTGALMRAVERAAQIPRQTLREKFGLSNGPLAIFMGSLYAEKRIDILLSAASELARRIPGFQLALAGDGPERDLVRQAAERYPFIHWLGMVRDDRKAEVLVAADVMFNPGAVGLGILDAFVAGLPLLTCDSSGHGPEISYLRHGYNGLMVPANNSSFVEQAMALLSSPDNLLALKHGALQSASVYSVENMVRSFSSGILCCMENCNLHGAGGSLPLDY